MKASFYFILIASALFFFSCKNKPGHKTLFSLVDNTGIQFTNTVKDTKELNILNYRNFYNGGGVAIGDINNDGLADVFFTANQGSNKLFLNKGSLSFEDISARAGFGDKKQFSTGVVMVDINNDGWLDIYVSNAGHMDSAYLRKNQLFINNHDLTFRDSAEAYGLDDSGYTTQVSFFDYDLDGDLDCFMINNSPISPNSLNYANQRDLPDAEWPVAPIFKGGGDHLLRNDQGHFKDVTKQAGIHGSLISFGLGVTVGDVNDDGFPDVYVSNDYFERDYLYMNQGNGTFKDELEKCMQHTSLASMGADFGDINNDGYIDIFTTDMLPGDDYRLKTTLTFEDINVYRLKQQNGFYHQYFQNTLQLNKKNGTFADVANYAGVSATDWSWGGLMFDADNDGFTDLYVCNGIYHDLINQDFLDFFANDVIGTMIATGKKEDLNVIIEKMPSIHVLNKVYQNKGNLSFADVGESWGFSQPSFSNGAAYGDLDNDGDLDIVISNVNQPAFVYKNNSREQNQHNYIGVFLQDTGNNRFAIGSKIKIYAAGQVLSREIVPSRGFQSSIDYKTIIGLGNIKAVDSMIIQWPDLTYSKYLQPGLNKVYRLNENDEKKYPVLNSKDSTTNETVFTSVAGNFEKQDEDDYVDFFYERNIPRMLSREGPRAGIADVNGDGTGDVFIGGTAGHPARLYLQTAEGKFVRKEEQVFDQFIDFEDVAVLFFDCDKDGDQDLLIGPGGNNMSINSRQIQIRLLKNDGSGNFTLDTGAFPLNNVNINVAVPDDFDGDGDLDLFVGGRNIPHLYGVDPASYLFVNDGQGHFTDIAKNKNPDIAGIGMVTAASWNDVTGDGHNELIIAGEWMTPRIFSYHNAEGKFEELKNTGLENMYGWWQAVTVADLNGDGKNDILLGNIGDNFYLRPGTDRPVKLWVSDFDRNGIVDKILTYTIDGKDKPVFLKHDLEEAMPFLKKENLKHADYAKKSVQELIPAESLNKASVKIFNYSSSCVAINDGQGKFTVRKLPAMVQLSSINYFLCMDVNGDKRTDIVCGGNQFDFMPQLERLDASSGDILINDGAANFKWLTPGLTGLNLQGQLRDIKEIDARGKKYLLFLQNNEVPQVYKFNEANKSR